MNDPTLTTLSRRSRAGAPRMTLLQRKCACGAHSTGGECGKCASQRDTLRRRSIGAEAAGRVPAIVHQVLGSPGQVLSTATRSAMESRFGHDFSGVRVHTDSTAARSAQAVNALAYTVGSHVVFAPGQYAPDKIYGSRLLAHELTHVVQQAGTRFQPGATLSIGMSDDALELQAEAAAHADSAVPPIRGSTHGANTIQRAAVDAAVQSGGGTQGAEGACAGWFDDRESITKRAAEHYVRTELAGDRGTVERIECDLFNPDNGAYACTVHFSDGTPIRVIVRKDAIVVGVFPLQTMHPPPDRPLCWYDYACSNPNRDLVLTKRKCQTSTPSSGTPPGDGKRGPNP